MYIFNIFPVEKADFSYSRQIISQRPTFFLILFFKSFSEAGFVFLSEMNQ